AVVSSRILKKENGVVAGRSFIIKPYPAVPLIDELDQSGRGTRNGAVPDLQVRSGRIAEHHQRFIVECYVERPICRAVIELLSTEEFVYIEIAPLTVERECVRIYGIE